MAVNHSLLGMFGNASLLVKLVMLLLLFISLLSWTLIFYRGSFLKMCQFEWQNSLEKFTSGLDLATLYHQFSEKRTLRGVSSIYKAGFKEFVEMKKIGASTEIILSASNRAMNIAKAKELDKLEHNISILATIGSTSPYIGLFGTVWGIMSSFQALGQVQQASVAMVAPGISEALIATAMGLFAAIPAVIAYNRFSNRIDFLSNQYSTFQQEMLAVLSRKLHQHEAMSGVDYE